MRNLTLHIVNSVPYSNLNRDDAGTPKRAKIGGSLRGLLSSQAIKRGIRTRYEAESRAMGIDLGSVRSKQLTKLVVDRAEELNAALDIKVATKQANAALSALVKNAPTDKTTKDDDAVEDRGTAMWLSAEELEALAAGIAAANGSENTEGFMEDGKSGSLAIAAFGRMFASAPKYNTEASIAVSPALTSHAATMQSDYFSTVDDAPSVEQGRGAAHLGTHEYTSGIFYRSITIDKEQLRTSWTGFTSATARDQLTIMVEALVYGLPKGKKNSTAPYTAPLVVLAEEQHARSAYDFETPVLAHTDGGFTVATIENLNAQRVAARSFHAKNFGATTLSGTKATPLEGETVESLDTLVASVVDWILE